MAPRALRGEDTPLHVIRITNLTPPQRGYVWALVTAMRVLNRQYAEMRRGR